LAVKKSELYSSLWASCDELRGGMDASQYKDYVLVLLFIKYVSDKYAGQPYAPITIPPGSSFKDLAALKGDPGIGDKINKNIVGPLAAANHLADMPDFNDAGKLGSGRDMVDRLTGLISIFENKALDFSRNQADGDDILGDATFRTVVTTALGIPPQIAYQDIGAQEQAITSHLDIKKLQDPKFVEGLTQQYLVAMQQSAASTSSSTGSNLFALAAQSAGLLV